MTVNDVYPFIVPAFFGVLLIASAALLWRELARQIEPYSKGD